MVNRYHLKPLIYFTLGFLCVFPPQSRGQEEVRMKIRSEGLRRIVLAVSPFSSDRDMGVSDDLRRVVMNDLDLSGFFEVIDLTQSDRQGRHDSGSGDERKNRPENASVLLRGDVDIRGNGISFKARLEEQSTHQKILDKTYEASVSTARSLGHRIADEVTYYLTGDRGIANTQIAYVTGDENTKEIVVMDYDGFGPQRVTSNRSLNLTPCWSPDGKLIAFTSYASGNPDLCILRLSDGRTVNLSKQNVLHSAPDWSPDGKHIGLTVTRDGNPDIYTMSIDDREMRRLTFGPAIDSSPSWSPDGREIAFTSNRSGSPQIYIMDRDGGNVRRLTYEGSYNESPAWSPRGDLIAFVSREETGFQIYTVDVNGENLLRLTDGTGNNENPSWSANGMWLVFASNRTGSWHVYILSWDGVELHRLTTRGQNESPSWSPRLKYE